MTDRTLRSLPLLVLGLLVARGLTGCGSSPKQTKTGDTAGEGGDSGAGGSAGSEAGGSGGGGKGGAAGGDAGAGGTGADTGGTMGGDDASAGAGGTGADGGTGSLSYKDVSPIFMKKCLTCHATAKGDKPSLATYAAFGMKPPGTALCPGATTLAACVSAVIKSGAMPYMLKCKNDGTDKNTKCLTKDEAQKIQDWIAAGTPM